MATPEELEQIRAYGQAMLGESTKVQEPSSAFFVSPLSILTRGMQALQGRSALDTVERGRVFNRTSRAAAIPGVGIGQQPSPVVAPTPPAAPGTTAPPTPPSNGATPPTSGVQPPASTTGLHPRFVDTLIGIESGGNPNSSTRNGRQVPEAQALVFGLGQFSRDLLQKYGVTDWRNVDQQRMAIARHAQANRALFMRYLNREPNPGELYLMHQQGPGGAVALLRNPNATAFDVLMSLDYYQRRGGARVVRDAIHDNLPTRLRPQWRTITAGDFANQWIQRFNSRLGTTPATPQAPATPAPSSPPAANTAALPPPSYLGGPTEENLSPALDQPGESQRLPSGPELAPEQELYGSPGSGQFISGTPLSPAVPSSGEFSTGGPTATPGTGQGATPPTTPPATPTAPAGVSGAPTATPQAAPPPAPYAGGRPDQMPPGVPQRIPPNPQLQMVINQLRLAANLSQEELNNLVQQYQTLAAPQTVQTAFGAATYNPLTGELMQFVPSVQNRQVTYPGGSSNQQLMWENGALRVVPIGPPGQAAPGTSGQTPGSGAQALPNANITSNLPPYPQTGQIADEAQWGMNAQAQGEIARRLGTSQAERLALAQDAGVASSRTIQTLNSVMAATRATAATNWSGDNLSRWQRQVATFLYNFGAGNIETLMNLPHTELLAKLNAQLAAMATSEVSARGTNFEFGTFLANNPNLSNTPAGTQMLIDFMIDEHKKKEALGDLASRQSPATAGDWNRIVDEYNRRNPVYLNIPAVGTRPRMRISTVRVPNVGDMKPDGGIYTEADVAAVIASIPAGAWFIHPVTGRFIPTRPRVTASASAQ